jgi:hypothetical protein
MNRRPKELETRGIEMHKLCETSPLFVIVSLLSRQPVNNFG